MKIFIETPASNSLGSSVSFKSDLLIWILSQQMAPQYVLRINMASFNGSEFKGLLSILEVSLLRGEIQKLNWSYTTLIYWSDSVVVVSRERYVVAYISAQLSILYCEWKSVVTPPDSWHPARLCLLSQLLVMFPVCVCLLLTSQAQDLSSISPVKHMAVIGIVCFKPNFLNID